MAQTLIKTIADFSTTLATKTAVGATTATLTSATDDDGVALPDGIYGFTIDRKESTKEYFTATLSSTSLTNIERVTRGTGLGTSGLAYTHRKGAEVMITDHVAIKRMMNVLDGTTDLDSDTPLKYDSDPILTDGKELATVKYANDIAVAGAPDASTITKGITKLSETAANPTNPIAVGDNDTRLPTQDENDALEGTSGTPSSINKYVTEDDVSNAAVSDKVVRATGTKLPALDGSNLTNIGIVKEMIATESINTNTPVHPTYYQADGGVTYDTSAIDSYSVPSSGGTKTMNLTIGNNNSRVLIVYLTLQNSGYGIPNSVTWAGQSMTLEINQIGYSGVQRVLVYSLFAPTVGTNTITATFHDNGQQWNGVISAYSFYNAQQSVDSTASSYNGSGVASATPTQVVDGTVYLTGYVNGSTTIPTGTNIANHKLTNATAQALAIGESGVVQPKGAMVATGDTYALYAVTIGIAPITIPSYGYVEKTSSSNVTNEANQNKYTNFMGFGADSAISGGTLKVKTSGIISGLSSLKSGATYYLSDTSGTISDTAGTNSKKVGIAISTTELLLKDSI